MPHHYFAYGLHIDSEWPFPELTPSYEAVPCDIRYRRASLSDLFDTRKVRPPRAMEEEVLFYWQDVCRFAMRRGREILFDPEPGIPDAAVRLILLGICMGITLHQRGHVVLHGSAVDVNGQALAFMGAKEAGKSTMVGALVRQGHHLISDDLVVLSPNGADHMLQPGYPSIKMWPTTARMLGLSLEDMPPLHELVDKRWFLVGDRFQQEAMPLAAMVMLEQGPGPKFESMLRRDALMRIVGQTYALRFLGKRGATEHYFQASARLVCDVPVYRLVRPMDAQRLTELVTFVEGWSSHQLVSS